MPVSVVTVRVCACAFQPRIFADAIVNAINVTSTMLSFNLMAFFCYIVAATAFKTEVA